MNNNIRSEVIAWNTIIKDNYEIVNSLKY